MKPSALKPGQRVIVDSGLGAPREMTFVRRLRPGFEIQLGQGAECLFQCEAFRGLNGPDDPGVCTMTDARAARVVRLVPKDDERIHVNARQLRPPAGGVL